MVKKIIQDHIQRPREMRWHINGNQDFTLERTITNGKSKNISLVRAWMIRYRGEPVLVLNTKREVLSFIKEKLET